MNDSKAFTNHLSGKKHSQNLKKKNINNTTTVIISPQILNTPNSPNNQSIVTYHSPIWLIF